MGENLHSFYNKNQCSHNKPPKYNHYKVGNEKLRPIISQQTTQQDNNECNFFWGWWRGSNKQIDPEKQTLIRSEITNSNFHQIQFSVVAGNKKTKGISVKAAFKCSSIMQRSMSSASIHLTAAKHTPNKFK